MSMNDRVLGALLTVGGLAFLVFYLWWLFISPWSWWAVAIPVLVAVGLLVFIGMWIGWTMATTPPPAPIEEKPVEVPAAEEKPAKN